MIRPLHVQDAAAFRGFVERLSPESRYARFQYVVKEVTPELLRLLLVVDPRSHVALGAFEDGRLVGEARYARRDRRGEFALAVADGWQRRGLGRRLLDHLLQRARRQSLQRIEGEVLADNAPMLALVTQAGFRVHPNLEDERLLRVERDVAPERRLIPAFSKTANLARFSIGAGFG